MDEMETQMVCLISSPHDSATVERRSSSDHHAMESKKEPLTQDLEAPRTKVDLDTILVEELGQFGWFQLRTLALAVLLVIFGAWAATEYVFTTARTSTRCLIPECETSSSAVFSPDWIFNAVPASGSGFDNCQRFANTSTSIVSSDTCPAALFDNNNIIECEDYVYENTHSVVYDYGLACDEWRRTLIGSIRTAGTLTALPITGFVSDRWGRKTALVINAFNTAWIGATRYFADTYIGFVISEFAEAMFGSGGFSTAYILAYRSIIVSWETDMVRNKLDHNVFLVIVIKSTVIPFSQAMMTFFVMEVMGPKYRVAAGATINTFFSVGQVTMGLIAWGVPNWRLLTLTLYIPQFLTILYIWLISESIRWYMSKGRYEESEAILKKAAKINGTQLSDKSLAALRETAEEEKRTRALEAAQSINEPWLIVQVFRHKRILIRCLVSPVWWITNTFIYYGMSINAVNMSGNRYVNYMAVSASEIPGYWTAYFLMGKIGRKPVLMGAFWMCCACQIGYIFMPQGLYAVSLTVYLIGKFSIAMVMTSVYVYTAELYPTKYRHSLFAFSSMVGRIGNIIAPLTPAFGASTFDELPFVLFATFAFVSGLLILVTPETLGTKLPDTMEEASDIGNKKKNKNYE